MKILWTAPYMINHWFLRIRKMCFFALQWENVKIYAFIVLQHRGMVKNIRAFTDNDHEYVQMWLTEKSTSLWCIAVQRWNIICKARQRIFCMKSNVSLSFTIHQMHTIIRSTEIHSIYYQYIRLTLSVDLFKRK